jgi:Family of unknown function (DUF5947)
VRVERNAEGLAKLRRFLKPRGKVPIGETCEFCSESIPAEHSHVVNVETRSLLCVCRACAFLFTHEGAAGGKYKAVPERYLRLVDPVLGEKRWEALQIPVNIAFFFRNETLDRLVGFYPSPAGATESQLPLTTWSELVRANPVLESLASDVEALLVVRHRDGEFDCYVVPIDTCYELVGRIRRRWKGFDGGEEAWQEIYTLLDGLNLRSQEVSATAGAER